MERTMEQMEQRSTNRQVLLCMTAYLTAVAPSMSIGFSAVSLPSMTDPNSSRQLTIHEASWMAAITSIGTPIGCFLCGPISDWYGRRASLLLVNVTAFLGWAIIALAPASPVLYAQLLLGRFMTGISAGLVSMPATVYMAETSSDAYRLWFTTAGSMAFSGGILAVYVLGYAMPTSWGTVALISTAIACLSMFCSIFFLPESPIWLVKHHKIYDAQDSLRRIYGHKTVTKLVENDLLTLIRNNTTRNVNKTDVRNNTNVNIYKSDVDKVNGTVNDLQTLIRNDTNVNVRKTVNKTDVQTNTNVNIYKSDVDKVNGTVNDLQTLIRTDTNVNVRKTDNKTDVRTNTNVNINKSDVDEVNGTVNDLQTLIRNDTNVNVRKTDVDGDNGSVKRGFVYHLNKKYLNLMKPECRRPLLIMTTYFFFQQFSGTFVIIFYAVKIVQISGGNIDPYMGMLLIGITRFLMAVLICAISEQCGRRPPSLFSGVGMTFTMLSLAAYIHANQTYNLSEHYGYVPIVCLVLYILVSTPGFVSVPFAMSAEVFPMAARGVASGLVGTTAHIFNFAVVKSFDATLERIGACALFALYGFVALAGTVFVYKWLPETKGKTMAEIEEGFRRTGRGKCVNSRASGEKIPLGV